MSPRLAIPMTFHEAFGVYTTARRLDLDEGVLDWFREARDFMVSLVNGMLSKVTFIDDLREIDGVEALIGKLEDETAALEGKTSQGKIGEPRYGDYFRAPEMVGSAAGRIIGTAIEGIAKMITWPVDAITDWTSANPDIAVGVTLFAVIGGLNALMAAPGSGMQLAGIMTAAIPAITGFAQAVVRKLTNRKGLGLGGVQLKKSGRPKGSAGHGLRDSGARAFGDFDRLDEGLLDSIKQAFLGLFTDTEALKQGVASLGLDQEDPDIKAVQAKVIDVIQGLKDKGVDIDSEAFRWGMSAGRLFKAVVSWIPKRILKIILSVLPRGMAQRFWADKDFAAFITLALGIGQISLISTYAVGPAGGAIALSAGLAFTLAALAGAMVSSVQQFGRELFIGD